MFNWLKKRKQNKELKQNLIELKKMILDINIAEDSSGKELEEFYTKINIWAKVLEEKQIEFFTAIKELFAEFFEIDNFDYKSDYYESEESINNEVNTSI